MDLSRAEFYRKLAAEPVLPITSQPTAKMFEEAFRPHVEAGAESSASSSVEVLRDDQCRAFRRRSNFRERDMTIVDSVSVAGGLGMMVLHAQELAKRARRSKRIWKRSIAKSARSGSSPAFRISRSRAHGADRQSQGRARNADEDRTGDLAA